MNQASNMTELPLSQIVPSQFNPRKFFDENELNELANSIREDGVIQPIVVRPILDDQFEIVAGERRWRASGIAGLETIPCTVKEMDDKTAIRLAAKENMERSDMSIIEEAYACQTALTLVDGDRAAAYSVLGWNETKLSKRLLLLNLSDKAQEALMKKEINVGHAELLASLTQETQDGAVDSIIEKKITVSELKEKLSQFAYKIETAIFSTDKCNGCPNNTSSQFSLFEESIGDGCCTNPTCWDEKEKVKLAYIKKSKEEDYNIVFLDFERSKGSFNYILESKVGVEQFSQCQQCQKYGALINTRRETLGDVDEDVCFDTDCYKEKTKAQVVETASVVQSDPAKKKTTSKKSTAKKPVDNKPPKKVLEFRTKLYKSIVGKELVSDRHLVTVMNACILLEGLPHQHHGVELIKEIQPLFNITTDIKRFSSSDRSKNIHKLRVLSDDELNEIITFCTSVISASGSNQFDLSQHDMPVETLIEILQPELAEKFELNKAYLECNQKKGIIGLLKEVGFSDWLNQTTKKPESFVKLCSKTIEVILEKAMNSGFTMKGFVPKALYYKGYVNHLRGDESIKKQDAA